MNALRTAFRAALVELALATACLALPALVIVSGMAVLPQ